MESWKIKYVFTMVSFYLMKNFQLIELIEENLTIEKIQDLGLSKYSLAEYKEIFKNLILR